MSVPKANRLTPELNVLPKSRTYRPCRILNNYTDPTELLHQGMHLAFAVFVFERERFSETVRGKRKRVLIN